MLGQARLRPVYTARLAMPRFCSPFRLPALVFLILLLAGSVAWARPKASVLGLEVRVPSGSAVGAQDIANAAVLTEALRDAASPRFEITSDKRELQDEKVMGNCQTEAAGCMSALARGAEYLITGFLERKTPESKEYWLRIRLLNVKSKAYEAEFWQGFVAVSAVKNSGQLKEWAGRVHEALAGNEPVAKRDPEPRRSTAGKLVVTARNVKIGDVFVDGEKKGELADGTLTLALPPGSHEVAIDAKNHKRHEAKVTIASGQTQTIDAELSEVLVDRPPAASSNRKIWRTVAWSSAGVGLAAGGVLIYGWQKKKDVDDKFNKCVEDKTCLPGTPRNKELFDDGKKWQNVTYVTGAIAGVAGALFIVSAYKGYFSSASNEATTTSSRGKRKRREFAVTPVVDSTGGGAIVRFDW